MCHFIILNFFYFSYFSCIVQESSENKQKVTKIPCTSVAQPLKKPYRFEDGAKCAYDLGKSKFIVAKMFKGKPYINIREYYQRNDTGTKMFAGKKGVALTVENWRQLLKVIGHVERTVQKLEKSM